MKDYSTTAFPIIPPVDSDGLIPAGFPYPEIGLLMRDYFAAKAMQSMIARSSGEAKGAPLIAKYAYEFADAMMNERCKPGQLTVEAKP